MRASHSSSESPGIEEKRVHKGGVMVLWFCRQVEYSWAVQRWAAAHRMMCYGRGDKERRQLLSIADASKRTRGR